MADELHFAVIEIHTSPWEAHVSRGLLESEGIPAFLSSEHQIWINWPMSLTLGGVRLLVSVESAASARDVLAMRDRGELQAALVEQHGQSLERCSRCGATDLIEHRDWLAISLSVVLLLFCKASFPPAKSRKCKSCGGKRVASPHPSIEGDGQGLSPLAVPHVKR